MRLYKQFSGNELKVAEKIQQRRLQILVHSYLYYKKDKPVVSDADWDRWAKELVELQTDYPDIAEQVIYANDFGGWDGSTGAFFDFSAQIEQIAYRLTTLSSRKQNDAIKKPVDKVKKNILQRKLF